MDRTKHLCVTYDGVLKFKGDDQYYEWNNSFKDEDVQALEDFVASHIMNRGRATLISLSEGTHNRVARFRLELGGSDAALKFPKPGHSAGTLAAEKVTNEAAWLVYLKEKTIIPVPHVYSCHTKPELSLLKVPSILMEWMPGENLRDFLASKSSKRIRSTIYQQLASVYLQLYKLTFDGIGSVAKDSKTKQWGLQRPLTIDMHQSVLGISNYLTDDWPTEEFKTAKEYLDFVSDQQSQQLWKLLNINTTDEDENQDPPISFKEIARARYEARYRFKELCNTQFGLQDNSGPFRAFIPDIDMCNMTVDTATGHILGVFDLEFANTMPAQFACDPPLSLSTVLPGTALKNGTFDKFLSEYKPLLAQFLGAMRQEERKLGNMQKPLSAMMQDSWATKQVWVNFGLTHSRYVDAIYWKVLHDRHRGGISPELPLKVKEGMEVYVQQSEGQIEQYDDSLILYSNKVAATHDSMDYNEMGERAFRDAAARDSERFCQWLSLTYKLPRRVKN
ncbi:hypothetical protein NQ176_g258 [Zarea fungicola]|uniref:Uncharacterized protein n=1 Tax=Zarea fungicola TaxID=93591 RepID=A0ACC1NXG0_9HYPO|nr:hypothetical protein NQ176_g258 [Lecanicillium fungicola]